MGLGAEVIGRRETYSGIELKATFSSPVPNNTAFLALTSNVPISSLADFPMYNSL
jgi:hypothetical protein